MRNRFLILPLFFICSMHSFSQQIRLSEVKAVLNDISAREHALIDGNGDASAIIKARISLDNMEFLAELGINKQEDREGEV